MLDEIKHPVQQCVDSTGRALTADVWIDVEHFPVRWRAVFHETGSPPAEMLGSSASLERISEDLRLRVSQIQMQGFVSKPTH
jgi:hypothetical protein